MTGLNELMKNCLIEADTQNPKMNWIDTVVEAVAIYDCVSEEKLRFTNEEEGVEYFNTAVAFLLDCVLLKMVREGMVEVTGMDPDGELVYKATIEV